MRTFFNDLMVQMKAIWSRLDGSQRLVVSAVLFATVVGLGAIVWFAGQPSYEIVFVAKNGDEMARAQQALQQEGITYVSDDGRSFKVERSKVGAAQMAINKGGLIGVQTPSLGGSSSLMEDAATKAWRLDSVSRSQAVQAIQQLDGVLEASVSASKPRRSVAYRDRQNELKARATVVLRLRSGVPFESIARSAASITSSQMMVPMENIDVVSTTAGQRWSYNPDREAGGGSSEFLSLQRNISDERTRLAQRQLDQMWPGKTAVRVTVELDPTWEIRRQKVVPTEALIRTEKKTTDTTDTPAAQDGVAGKSKNTVTDKEYVTDIGELRSGKLMPEMRRMSVAVLYDRSLETTDGFNEQDLIRTIKAIVGWDADRDKDEAFSTMVGDFVPVEADVLVSAGPGIGDMVARWGPTFGQILGVLVVVMFLRGLFKRSSASKSVEKEAEPEVAEEDLAPAEQQKRMRREIERSIASDPAALAKMLETWLMEQRA